MESELARVGIAAQECVAKVFGGGRMFPDLPDSGFQIGNENGDRACDWLRRHQVRIVAENLYGSSYRQIIFDVRMGDVWVKRVELRASSI